MFSVHVPEVSVIVPVYNRGSKIIDTVNSVLNQTYEDFELVIVDDGSTDDTPEFIMSIRDRRIVYLRYERNRERSAARNSGIRVSKGKYIAFLDHDDEWLPEKLQKQMSIMSVAPNNVGVVYSGYYQIWGDETVESPFLRVVKKFEGDLHDEILRGDFVHNSTALVRREVLESVGGFDECLAGPEVWDLWIRVSQITHFKFIREPLVRRYIHGENGCLKIKDPFLDGSHRYLLRKHGDFGLSDLNRWLFENFENIDEFIEYCKSKGRRLVIFGASLRGRGVLRWLKNRQMVCEYFVDNDSKKWGNIVDGVEVRPPETIREDDIVFVASTWAREIVEQLHSMGVYRIAVMPI